MLQKELILAPYNCSCMVKISVQVHESTCLGRTVQKVQRIQCSFYEGKWLQTTTCGVVTHFISLPVHPDVVAE